MSRPTDRLESAYGEFNQNLVVIREFANKEMAEGDNSPESHAALVMLESLDAVLDELVTAAIKASKKKTKKSPK